jgi:hypothetical protein
LEFRRPLKEGRRKFVRGGLKTVGQQGTKDTESVGQGQGTNFLHAVYGCKLS